MSDPCVLTLTLNPALDLTTRIARLEPQVKLPAERPRVDPGGGGVNVARMITRLGGLPVTALVALGGGVGARYRRHLVQEGLAHEVFPIAGETRETWQFMVREAPPGTLYRIVLPGPEWGADEAASLLAIVRRRLAEDPPAWLVLSGSLPAGLDPDFYGRIVRICRRAAPATRIALDTRGAALVAGLKAGVDLVKPDRHEVCDLARALGAGEGTLLTLARRIVAQGCTRVFVYTLGADGAVVVTAEDAWRWRPPMVEVHSLVGAGDHFLGALIRRRLAGDDWRVASRFAMAAAAATAETPGTTPPDPVRIRELAGLVEEADPAVGSCE
ncbi:MAG: 1-phosphofructokinase family hexose kinase [Alphaproteobacteria bacterium]|nr:MAG: 1-phosphofructokinase family hexose kinase [Alphaproteobacteria bacterium]